METFLREYRWVVNLALITAGALMLANIVNHVVASKLAPMTVPSTPTWQSTGPKDAGQQPTDKSVNQNAIKGWDDALSSRCLFGCAQSSDDSQGCPDGCADDEVCEKGMCIPKEAPEPSTQADSDVPVESDINVKLLGCMVADNAEYSMALFQDGESQQTFVVSVGDALPGGAAVKKITRDRVFIRRNGQMEYIRLDQTIGGDPSPVSISRRGSSRPSSSNRGSGDNGASNAPEPRNVGGALRDLRQAKNSDDDSGGSDDGSVRKVSDNEYVVDEKKFEEKVEDREKLARQGELVPNYDRNSEEKKGVKMISATPDSVYSDMGLETGDVITSVNGESIENPRDVEDIIEAVRDGGASITVERNGRTIERNYRVDD